MGSHKPTRFLPFCVGRDDKRFAVEKQARRSTGTLCGRLFSGILKVCCLYKIFSLGAHSDAEAHISTESPPPRQDAWLPDPHEDQGGPGRTVAPSRQGPQARVCQPRLPRLTPVTVFTPGSHRRNLLIPRELRFDTAAPLGELRILRLS